MYLLMSSTFPRATFTVIVMALYFLGHEKGDTAALATWVGVGESHTERSIDADITAYRRGIWFGILEHI